MICLDCAHHYVYESDTLSIASGNRGQCPKCASEKTMVKENFKFRDGMTFSIMCEGLPSNQNVDSLKWNWLLLFLQRYIFR